MKFPASSSHIIARLRAEFLFRFAGCGLVFRLAVVVFAAAVIFLRGLCAALGGLRRVLGRKFFSTFVVKRGA